MMEEKIFNNPETLKMPEHIFSYSESETGSSKEWNYVDGIKSLNLINFPLLEDFSIKVIDTKTLGKHIYYFSEKEGVLTSFPWWDNVEVDIKNWDIKNIPLGSLDAPFDDLDQGWQVLIFKDIEYVYILEGDEPGCEEFKSWYKVPLEKYINEWKRVLDLRN